MAEMGEIVHDIEKDAKEVRDAAEGAVGNKWILLLARFGYIIKGILYIVIGILAIQISVGIPTKTPGQKGALEAISNLPLGRVLIIIVAIGLASFALWALIQAIFDTESKGHTIK
ncbi:MAG TPA: hypothetical protein DHW02_25135, partial [Ktedonobacter sp.]|nr:hypothetical protein [Ktedonobacter sp.]